MKDDSNTALSDLYETINGILRKVVAVPCEIKRLEEETRQSFIQISRENEQDKPLTGKEYQNAVQLYKKAVEIAEGTEFKATIRKRLQYIQELQNPRPNGYEE